jgi:group I intron endonuclease
LNTDKGIYEIRNNLNGRSYVGVSKEITRRWKDHLKMLMAGEHHSFELQSDWDEIGIKHFSFHILELCDDNQLKEVKGYNMTTFHVSAEKLHAENNRLKKENSYLKNLLNIDVDEIFKPGRHPRSLANLTQNKNKKQTEMIDPIKLKDGESEEERKELIRRKLD